MPACPSCRSDNPAGARFCNACGARLEPDVRPPREERKLVTVLFADLVGFTARSERLDPEDVRAMLSPYFAALRAELERHGGTVEKFIGDAVMAIFGAPVAHEDDPERAVRAALAIRERIAEGRPDLQVRIGITTGEALVSLGARAAEGEGMAAGDVVNTAARLQAAAPVDGILVGERTYQATRRAIEYRATEAVHAKGKQEPVPAWEAVQARSRFGVDTVHEGAPLVGRERELGLLRDALARALGESRAQLVTLVGVPGMGKSRLVYELARLADAEEELIAWRQGRSLPYGEGVTYWALSEMVKAHCGVLETDATDAVAAKLHEAVAAVLPDEAESRRVEGHLRPLLGLDSDAERGGEHGAWRRFFEALAEHGPVVLVFEDLHWADDRLLDFVDNLVDWVTEVPLVVVCTARPELLERRPAWGGGKLNALVVSLSALSDRETAHLIASLAERSVLPATTQAALLARAGGNPLYAEQFVRMLRERGGDDLPLPENVQGIIAARLDGVPAEEKELLQAAAVLGKVFWGGAVAAVAGADPADVEVRLHALERKQFVRRERRSSVAEELEYAFQHSLLRDVAYGQMPRAARAGKHRLAAGWIAALGRAGDHAEMLAHHYQRALEYAGWDGQDRAELERRARRALTDAGDRALALGVLTAASRFYEAAVERYAEDDPERPLALLRVGRSRPDDAAFDDAVLEGACTGLSAQGDLEGAAEAQALLASIAWVRGSRERATEHLDRAVNLLPGDAVSATRARVLSAIARVAMLAGENQRSIEVGGEALQLAEQLGLTDVTARVLMTVGTARALAGDPEGSGDIERAIELAAAADHTHLRHMAMVNLASIRLEQGDVRAARALHEQAMPTVVQHGYEADVEWLRAELIVDRYFAGEWTDAEVQATEYLAGDLAARRYMSTVVHEVRGRIRRARGDLAGGLSDGERQLALAREIQDPQVLYPALATRADALAAAGRRAEALELARELLAHWAAEGPAGGYTSPCDLAWALRALGRPEELLDAVGARTSATPWVAAAVSVARGEFRAAADRFAEIGSLPDEARARLRAAAEEPGLDAEAELERALGFYRSVGATAFLREAGIVHAARRRAV